MALAHQISLRSEDFFLAVSSQDKLQDDVGQTNAGIKHLRFAIGAKLSQDKQTDRSANKQRQEDTVDRQTDTDGQTDKQTEIDKQRQIDRQTERQTDRQTDTNRQTDTDGQTDTEGQID